MRSINFYTILLILVTYAITIFAYSSLPQNIVTHWNFQGIPDGEMTKFWGLLLIPIVITFMYLLFLVIPKIDPLKENIKLFRKYFDGFIFLIIFFMVYIHMLLIFWNLGYKFDIGQFMSPAIGILFFYIGIMLKQSKRNWFIGIRTPWTLSSDSVWDKTHKLGAVLFKTSGVFAFIGVFFPNYGFFLILVPIILSAVVTIVYSYFAYSAKD